MFKKQDIYQVFSKQIKTHLTTHERERERERPQCEEMFCKHSESALNACGETFF